MNEGLILYILDVADNLAKAIGMGLIFSVLTSFLVFLNSFFPSTEVLELWLM